MARRVTIDGRSFDAVLSYEPLHEAQATEHPVEQGADPTDHIRVMPITIEIRGVQTATPVEPGEATEADLLARPRDAYAFLLAILTERRLVSVVTELSVFDNMALTRLSAPRDGTTGDVLDFAASFRQVRVVTSLTIEEPTIAVKPKKLGKVPTKETPATTVDKSIAAELADTETGRGFLDFIGASWAHE